MRSLLAVLGVAAAALPAASGAVAAMAGSASRPVLPFIRDDYPRALAEARARRLPLFIESWAPW